MNRSSFRSAMPFVLIAGWVLCAASAAHAQVVLYDNLGNQPLGFRSVDASNWQGQRFNTDSNNLMLTSATLKLFNQNGGSGTFFLKLFSDNASLPGTALATLASGPNPLSGLQGDVAFNGLNQLLLANTNYWIVFGDNPGPSLDLRWGVADPPGSGFGFQVLNASTSNQGTNWSFVDPSHAMQMQLIGSVVPEPGSMLLAGLGLASIWRFRRKKQIVA